MNTNLTTIKTSNKRSSEFARKKQPFKASNLNGEYFLITIIINIIMSFILTGGILCLFLTLI